MQGHRTGCSVRRRGQNFVHRLLKGRMRDDLNALAAAGVANAGEGPFEGEVAAPDMAPGAKDQDAVLHGVEHGLKLGRLIGVGVHLLFNALGHAVDGTGQGLKFLARIFADASVEPARRDGLDNVDHGREGAAQGLRHEKSYDEGNERGPDSDLDEQFRAVVDGPVHIFHGHGQPEHAAPFDGRSGVGELESQ